MGRETRCFRGSSWRRLQTCDRRSGMHQNKIVDACLAENRGVHPLLSVGCPHERLTVAAFRTGFQHHFAEPALVAASHTHFVGAFVGWPLEQPRMLEADV